MPASSVSMPVIQELLSPPGLVHKPQWESVKATDMSVTIEERGRPNTQDYRVFFSKHSSLNFSVVAAC